MMTGPPPSGIRRFYGKIESVGDRNEKYLCGLCSTVVSSSVAATSNLIKHMRRHHPKEFENYQREQGRTDLQAPSRSNVPQQRPGGSGNVDRRIRFMEENHDANIRRLVRFLAGTLLPPSVVDATSFTQFVHGLEPRFTIPSSHQLNMAVLPQTYEDLKEKLKETLSNAQGVCLTIDVLKDHYENYYFIILVSYITADWRRCSTLLTCKMFKTLPTKSFILATYESIVNEMNIENKIQSIVIGKLRNKKKLDISFIGWDTGTDFGIVEEDYFMPHEAFDALWEELPMAQRCFNDVLQDVVGKGIAQTSIFQEQIQKISSLVYSITVLLNGGEAGKIFNPISDWTEQMKFLKKSLRCSPEVFQCAVSSLAYEEQENFLSSTDRSILNEIIEVFEAFEDASDRLQNMNGIASSQVLPIIRGLRHHLRSLKQSHSNTIVKALSLALEEKLATFETNEVLQQASMVDPRFKTAWCSAEEQSMLQSKLQMSVIRISLKEPNTNSMWNQRPVDTPKRPKLFSFMASECPSPKQWLSSDINECAREEVNRFLASPCREHDVNPLDFWRGMETEFPLIAAVARRCLCTQVSTGSIKDIFGGDAPLSRGIHLHEDEFDRLVFLKANMEKI